MMRKFFVFLCFFPLLCFANFCEDDVTHEFSGTHFLASYLECDLCALTDLPSLQEALNKAVAASGATILKQTSHIFAPDGWTAVYLLSESHASIHTYPECGACFVDLFTCGNNCSSKAFDQALRAYLQPKTVNARVFLRNSSIQEIP